jgi:hypothetical protein
MLDTDPSFRLFAVREDYPPLEDLGLIGDGATVALVGLDGGIYWLCLEVRSGVTLARALAATGSHTSTAGASP